jgi:DNA-binding GntR family transcriptional regulator
MDIAIALFHAIASERESSQEMRLRVSQTSLPELTSVYSRNVIQTLGLRSSVTLSDQIFNALVEEIISGAIEPGFRLDEPSICRKFNVSRTPIREALRRLNGAGLVEITPRRGVTVARINVLELNEMFEALAEFEGLCAGLSAVRMTSLEKKRLEMLNKSAQSRIVKGQGDLVRLNNEFHESIYLGAHNASIASTTKGFRQRLAPFRSLQFVRGQTEYSFHEHDEVVRAIIDSDVERATTSMRNHVIGAGLQVIDHFSETRGVSDAGPSLSRPKRSKVRSRS